MTTCTAASSQIGLRETQQDRYFYCQIDNWILNIICDGNGGPGGDILAETATKSVSAEVGFRISQLNNKEAITEEHLREICIESIKKAAVHVTSLKMSNPEWSGAGTTITLVVITDDLIGLSWVGDSPCYMLQDNEFTKLTHPVHTVAEELIEDGLSREDLTGQHRLHSTLTKCIGHGIPVPDSKIIELKEPCLVMLGSDGGFDYLSEEEIRDIIKDTFVNNSGLQEIADKFVQLSLDNGSDDNATAILSETKPTQKLSQDTKELQACTSKIKRNFMDFF